MKKILILGTGRTASKLYMSTLNVHSDIYILHEIMFDFRFKKDIHHIFKKHNVYQDRSKLYDAFEEIYNQKFFRNLKTEYPNYSVLVEELQLLDKITWDNVLTVFIETKAKKEKKNIAGAKNPVHFSFAPKVIKFLKDVNIIYLMRDPRALYASEIPMKFKDSSLSQFPRLKSEKLQRILIFLYVNLEWIWSMITYLRVRKNVQLCRYEDLVENHERVFEQVFGFCEVPYAKEITKELTVIGSSHKVENKGGVSQHGVEKWKEILNKFEKYWFTFIVRLFRYY